MTNSSTRTLSVSDLNTKITKDEPRIRDARLGERLGFDRARKVRDLIERNIKELQAYGAAPRRGALVKRPQGGTINVQEYWLNEAQSLLLCMFARTDKAAEVRQELISVFLAVRHGTFRHEQTRTTVTGGLTIEQQDEIKAMVRARTEAAPKQQRGAVAVKCWSAIKKKFGCSYKDVPAQHFADVVSLLARLEFKGIDIPAIETEKPVKVREHRRSLPSPVSRGTDLAETGLTRNGMAAMLIGGKLVIFDTTDICPQQGELSVFVHPKSGGEPFVSTAWGDSVSKPWGNRSTYLAPQREEFGTSMSIAFCLGKVIEVRGGIQ